MGDGRGHSCYDGCLAAGQTSYASAFFSLRSISLVGSSAASRPGFNVKSVGSFALSSLQDGNLLYQSRRSWLFPLENRLVAGVADITVLFCCVGLKGRFLESMLLVWASQCRIQPVNRQTRCRRREVIVTLSLWLETTVLTVSSLSRARSHTTVECLKPLLAS